MAEDNIYSEITNKAFSEWDAKLNTPAAERLTVITQRYFDEAYQRGEIPNRVLVTREDQASGSPFMRLKLGDETLAFVFVLVW